MTDTERRYRISNTSSGLYLGTYSGASREEALDALARDAGYRDQAHAAEVVGGMTDDLLVEVEEGA